MTRSSARMLASPSREGSGCGSTRTDSELPPPRPPDQVRGRLSPARGREKEGLGAFLLPKQLICVTLLPRTAAINRAVHLPSRAGRKPMPESAHANGLDDVLVIGAGQAG